MEGRDVGRGIGGGGGSNGGGGGGRKGGGTTREGGGMGVRGSIFERTSLPNKKSSST